MNCLMVNVTEKCSKEYAFGRIYRTPCYYPHENLELFRALPTSEEVAISKSSRFVIRPAGGDKFKHNFPLADPPLKSNEEFLVVRAKPRPVILLVPEQPIEGIETAGFGGKIWRRRCLVGQVFSDFKTRSAASGNLTRHSLTVSGV